MFRNVYYNRWKNEINLWSTINGKRKFEKIPWVPYLFQRCDAESSIKTIEGVNVIRKKFNSFKEYSNFQSNNENLFEDKVTPEIQFLAERYHKQKDENIVSPELKTFILDIEVHSEEGFPDPMKAEWPITAITVFDQMLNKYFTFGLYEYQTELKEELGEDDIQYYHIPDETELIKEFIYFINRESPDVITGWNIVSNKKLNTTGFDIPYIINRSKNKINDSIHQKLSPVGRVRSRENTEGGLDVDIEGISLLDYMAAYKWYTRKNPESFTLNYISTLELGKGKVDYQDYGSLKNLFNENWNLYIDYNIVDVKRIKEMDEKLGYISLIQSFSLIARCPMKYFTSMVTLLEGRMLTYYRNNNLCAPPMQQKERQSYPAAYVKQPVPGLYKWLFSIDIKSSYPTAIITLNMSTETYIGKIVEMDEQEVIKNTSARKFPEFEMNNYNNSTTVKFDGKKLKKFNMMLERGMICISPNGVCFKTSPEGVVTHVEKDMFLKRQQMKSMMRETNDERLKQQYNTFQQGLKILINSFYGIMAYPYGNRYTNPHIASAITACGRHAVKQGELLSNRVLNNPTEPLQNILHQLKSRCNGGV